MPGVRRAVLAAAVLAAAVGLLAGATGLDADILIAVPALAVALPLLSGRYVGEHRLARLARRPPRVRLRPAPVPMPPRPRRCAGPRGGLLIATARARRGPPPALVGAR